MASGPRILLFDIETAPILAYIWSLWDQNVGLNQIKSDWFVLSWAAKWYGEKEIMYDDQRNEKRIEDDKRLLGGIWKLLDAADIVVTQNGKAFDQKKLNARFIIHGFKPPSSFRHIDTKQLAKKHFGFTSNKLEYLSEKLGVEQKSKHKEFQGFELWRECLLGNKKAWNEMEKYNKQDVLSLESVYEKMRPWGTGINMDVYHDARYNLCSCGESDWMKYGFRFTNTGKFQRLKCKNCGAEAQVKENLLSKIKKATLNK